MFRFSKQLLLRLLFRKTASPSMSSSSFFRPLRLNARVELQHRIVLAPLTRCRSDDELRVTPLHVEYYAQRATAGGLLITEATNISGESLAYPHTPAIQTHAQATAWRAVTDAVHAKRGFMSVQLWHTGRVSHTKFRSVPVVAADTLRLPPVGPSTVPIAGRDEEPRALSLDDIARLKQDYINAAKLAIDVAGFDFVELHAAHGYLPDQFLNDKVNVRTDQYGGSIENRARFLLEVLAALQAAVGADRVAVRISPHWPETMKFNGVDDSDPRTVYDFVFRELDKLNLAYVLLTEPRWRGGARDLVEKDPGMAMPLTFAPHFRSLYRGVLIGAGGFTPSNARAALDDNHVDGVAFGRWFISNPDLVERLKTGVPLTRYNRETFYGEGPVGYTDYPFLGEDLGAYSVVEQSAIGSTLNETLANASKL
jgi:2,4-dienoyl-CoA reductase-like NADH-dependent reductase (Old Yellow Enzyme family)